MIVPYENKFIPTFKADEVPLALDRILHSGLPAALIDIADIVKPSTDPNVPIADIPTVYGSLLLQKQFQFTEHNLFIEEAPRRDFPLHIDYAPIEPTPTHAVEKLNFHLTQAGRAEVSFFEPKEAFWQTGLDDVTEDQDEGFENGLIDNEYFNPTRHTTIVEAPGLLIFRLQGLVPLAHKFKTTRLERISHIWMAERCSTNSEQN